MKKNFDFVGHLKLFAMIAAGVLVFGAVFNVIFGTKLDVAFKGGTLIRYSYEQKPDLDKLGDTAKKTLGNDATVAFDNVNDTDIVSVTLPGAVTMEQQDAFAEALEKDFAEAKLTSFSSNTLSASMGTRFLLRCLLALVLAAVLLLVYVSFRFRKIGGFSAGVTALIALAHDLLIVYFTFVVFRIDLNENFVAVMLTILGYSLNDTIVIFDRIRTNRRRSTAPLRDIVNDALNACKRRTVITSVTTGAAILTVLVVALVMNVDSIISFALPMLFGTVAGCYSSLFLSAPIWTLWTERREAKAAAAKKKA